MKRRSVKRRISEGPPRVSFRGLFCGISQKRPYYPVAAADDPLRQQLRQLCGTSPCVSFAELCQAWIFVVQQVASFLSLSLSRTHHKALARGISTRGSRAKNGGARKKSRPLKTQSSLNHLLTDRWIAHNICRVCQSLHSKEREQIRSFHGTFYLHRTIFTESCSDWGDVLLQIILSSCRKYYLRISFWSEDQKDEFNEFLNEFIYNTIWY